MKNYKRRNNRIIERVNNLRGMAKTNIRKRNNRVKFELVTRGDADIEMCGTTLNPQPVPKWCDTRNG